MVSRSTRRGTSGVTVRDGDKTLFEQAATAGASFDVTGRLVGGGAVVAEGYASRSVTVF